MRLPRKKEHSRIIWSKMPGRTLPESVLQRKTERRLHGCIMIRFLTMAGCFQLFPAALPLLMSLCLRKVRNVTRPNLRFIWTPDVITRSVCSLLHWMPDRRRYKYNPKLTGNKGWQTIRLCAYKLDFKHPVTHKAMHFPIRGRSGIIQLS